MLEGMASIQSAGGRQGRWFGIFLLVLALIGWASTKPSNQAQVPNPSSGHQEDHKPSPSHTTARVKPARVPCRTKEDFDALEEMKAETSKSAFCGWLSTERECQWYKYSADRRQIEASQYQKNWEENLRNCEAVQSSASPTSESAEAISPATPTRASSAIAYTNDRFGFQLNLPSDFRPQAGPENGDGQAFASPDGQMVISVSGGNGGAEVFPLQETLADAVTNTPGTVLEKKVWDNGFMLSWDNPENGMSGITAQFIGSASHNTLTITYPKGQSDFYRPIVQKVLASFKPGDLNIAG